MLESMSPLELLVLSEPDAIDIEGFDRINKNTVAAKNESSVLPNAGVAPDWG